MAERFRIINEYLKNGGLVNHQTASFNDFIYHGIQRIIKEAEVRAVIADVHYSLTFGGVHVAPPSLLNENRHMRPLFPNEARTRDLTYEASVYVDVIETLSKPDALPVTKVHPRVFLTNMPVMLMSKICHLSQLSRPLRVKVGECEFEQGGYFVVKGNERVLVGQIRATYNNPILVKQKAGDRFSYVCEVRSMSEETGHSVLIHMKLLALSQSILITLPNIKEAVPLMVVFRALGFAKDDLYWLMGISEEESATYEPWFRVLERDADNVARDAKEALFFIGSNALHNIKENCYTNYAHQVVFFECLPHMGIVATYREKARYLGLMARRLIDGSILGKPSDDRDNYRFKRVEMSGVLCAELFRALFKRFIKNIQLTLDKKKQLPDIVSLINRLNTITKGIRSSFTNSAWGISKNGYTRSGVSQVVNRMTYGCYLSHMRRIKLPISQDMRNPAIRQLHASQIMFICPCETPEGANIGKVLNLAMLATVTTRFPTNELKTLIERSECCLSLDHCYEHKIHPRSLVMLNGSIVAATDQPARLLSYFEECAEVGLIDRNVSYSVQGGDVCVFCDEGRLLRPLIKLGDGNAVPDLRGRGWDELVRARVVRFLDNSMVETSTIAMNEADFARGARYDYLEIHPSVMMGVMASAIPFPEFNQSPRNLYSSSMMKQAIGFFSQAYKLRTDTAAHVLSYPQRPLINTALARCMGFDDMPSGVNAIVAILCHTGFNQEDSILVKRSCVERGMFVTTCYKTIQDEERKQGMYEIERICFPPVDIRKPNVNYAYLDDDGVVREHIGTKRVYVSMGDVIIGKVLTNTNKDSDAAKDCSYVIKHGEEGYIDKVVRTTTLSGYTMVKVVIRTERIPELGDKLANREAQKSTIGLIMNEEDMPFSAEGIVPDLIVNSHAIPSRMTLNMLLEMLLGKSCLLEGRMGDATPFENTDVLKMCEELQKHGYERHGWQTLYSGTTGEPIEAQVFIGPCYYARLKHMVADKSHARAFGEVNNLLRQPVAGRSRAGALRFGTMETDCMISHGTSRFLKERLCEKSDMFAIVVCEKCGYMTVSKSPCRNCGSVNNVKVVMPYAAKQLCQELMAMNIKMVFRH